MTQHVTETVDDGVQGGSPETADARPEFRSHFDERMLVALPLARSLGAPGTASSGI